MKKNNRLLFFFFIASILFSCRSELPLDPDRKISSLEGTVIAYNKNRIDSFIDTNFTRPYNIQIIYRWEDREFDQSKNLVPADTANIVSLLKALKSVWLDNYVKLGGETFMKRLSPKLIVLSGGNNYNPDGSTTGGTADASKKITFFNINSYIPGDTQFVNYFFHLIQHEFAHILHQNRLYDISKYIKIAPGIYKGDWYNYTDEKAKEEGAITSYALKARDEDFAEMIGTMLTNSYAYYDQTIIGASSGRAKIKAKEAIIVDYYKTAYNIDFYALQDSMYKSMQAVL